MKIEWTQDAYGSHRHVWRGNAGPGQIFLKVEDFERTLGGCLLSAIIGVGTYQTWHEGTIETCLSAAEELLKDQLFRMSTLGGIVTK